MVTRQDSSDILLNYSRDVLAAAAADARDAVNEFDGARRWLPDQTGVTMVPIGVEVWVLDDALASVLLIRHRWRGWVPPGGKVDPGEAPRAAATRELFEETGVTTATLARPAAAAVRSYKPGWSATLGLSYAAIVPPTTRLHPEDGQQGRGCLWTVRGRRASKKIVNAFVRTPLTSAMRTCPSRTMMATALLRSVTRKSSMPTVATICWPSPSPVQADTQTCVVRPRPTQILL